MNEVTLRLQKRRSFLIMRDAFRRRVLRAVHLHDELRAVADEIDNVGIEGCLPAEVQARVFPLAKRSPEDAFR